MPTKVYARTNTVPDGCDYITPGKAYAVISEDRHGFTFIVDNGNEGYAFWRKSIMLGGSDWERIETDGEAPDTIAPPSRWSQLTIAEIEADIAAAECALKAKREEVA